MLKSDHTNESTKKSKPRICFISHDQGTQGAELALVDLAKNLKRHKNYDVHVICPGNKGGLIDILTQADISYSVIPFRWWMGRGSFFGKIYRFCQNVFALPLLIIKFKKERFDIIYSNSITVNVGACAAKLTGIPHIWHIHEYGPFGVDDYRYSFDFGNRLSFLFMRWSTAQFIVISHAVSNAFKTFLPMEKMKVVYQSIESDDEGKALPIIKNCKNLKIVILGALMKAKRQEDILRALPLLLSAGCQADVFLIGAEEPKYVSKLRKLAKKYDIEGNVHFCGTLKKPIPSVAACDISIISSSLEGFGRVTIESMLASTTVIGTNSGATSELITDGVTGFLYTPGNNRTLANLILALARNNELSEKVSSNAKKWANERFNSIRYIEEIDSLLKPILSLNKK